MKVKVEWPEFLYRRVHETERTFSNVAGGELSVPRLIDARACWVIDKPKVTNINKKIILNHWALQFIFFNYIIDPVIELIRLECLGWPRKTIKKVYECLYEKLSEDGFELYYVEGKALKKLSLSELKRIYDQQISNQGHEYTYRRNITEYESLEKENRMGDICNLENEIKEMVESVWSHEDYFILGYSKESRELLNLVGLSELNMPPSYEVLLTLYYMKNNGGFGVWRGHAFRYMQKYINSLVGNGCFNGGEKEILRFFKIEPDDNKLGKKIINYLLEENGIKVIDDPQIHCLTMLGKKEGLVRIKDESNDSREISIEEKIRNSKKLIIRYETAKKEEGVETSNELENILRGTSSVNEVFFQSFFTRENLPAYFIEKHIKMILDANTEGNLKKIYIDCRCEIFQGEDVHFENTESVEEIEITSPYTLSSIVDLSNLSRFINKFENLKKLRIETHSKNTSGNLILPAIKKLTEVDIILSYESQYKDCQNDYSLDEFVNAILENNQNISNLNLSMSRYSSGSVEDPGSSRRKPTPGSKESEFLPNLEKLTISICDIASDSTFRRFLKHKKVFLRHISLEISGKPEIKNQYFDSTGQLRRDFKESFSRNCYNLTALSFKFLDIGGRLLVSDVVDLANRFPNLNNFQLLTPTKVNSDVYTLKQMNVRDIYLNMSEFRVGSRTLKSISFGDSQRLLLTSCSEQANVVIKDLYFSTFSRFEFPENLQFRINTLRLVFTNIGTSEFPCSSVDVSQLMVFISKFKGLKELDVGHSTILRYLDSDRPSGTALTQSKISAERKEPLQLNVSALKFFAPLYLLELAEKRNITLKFNQLSSLTLIIPDFYGDVGSKIECIKKFLVNTSFLTEINFIFENLNEPDLKRISSLINEASKYCFGEKKSKKIKKIKVIRSTGGEFTIEKTSYIPSDPLQSERNIEEQVKLIFSDANYQEVLTIDSSSDRPHIGAGDGIRDRFMRQEDNDEVSPPPSNILDALQHFDKLENEVEIAEAYSHEEFLSKFENNISQIMIIDKLVYYLSMKKEFTIYKKIRRGVCSVLTEFYSKDNQKWNQVLDEIYRWDLSTSLEFPSARISELVSQLISHLEKKSTIKKVKDSFKEGSLVELEKEVDRKCYFLGNKTESLKKFIQSIPDNSVLLIKSVWHQISIVKRGKKFTFYDPNHSQGELTIDAEKVSEFTLISTNYNPVLMVEAESKLAHFACENLEKVECDLGLFMSWGGLFLLNENISNSPKILDEAIMHYVLNDGYTVESVESLLIRDNNGVPAWLFALSSRPKSNATDESIKFHDDVNFLSISFIQRFLLLARENYYPESSISVKSFEESIVGISDPSLFNYALEAVRRFVGGQSRGSRSMVASQKRSSEFLSTTAKKREASRLSASSSREETVKENATSIAGEMVREGERESEGEVAREVEKIQEGEALKQEEKAVKDKTVHSKVVVKEVRLSDEEAVVERMKKFVETFIYYQEARLALSKHLKSSTFSENKKSFLERIIKSESRSQLIKTESKALSHAIIRSIFSSSSNNPIYYISSVEDLRCFKTTIKIGKEKVDKGEVRTAELTGNLYDFIIQNKENSNAMIVVNYDSFRTSEFISFNTFIEENPKIDGQELGSIRIVGLLNVKRREAYLGADFLSRFSEIHTNSLAISQYEEDASEIKVLDENPPEVEDGGWRTISFYGRSEPGDIFNGKWHLGADGLTYERSQFVNALLDSKVSGINIINPPENMDEIITWLCYLKKFQQLPYDVEKIEIKRKIEFSIFKKYKPSLENYAANIGQIICGVSELNVPVLNRKRLGSFFQRYTAASSCEQLISVNGIIEEHKDRELRIQVNSSLDEVDYFRILEHLKKFNVKASFNFLDESFMPEFFRESRVMDLGGSLPLEIENVELIKSEDIPLTLQGFKSENSVFICISDVSPSHFSDSFVASFEQGRDPQFVFSKVNNVIISILREGKDVILYGEISQDFADDFQSYLCNHFLQDCKEISSNGTKKVYLVSNDYSRLPGLEFKVQIYSPEFLKTALFDRFKITLSEGNLESSYLRNVSRIIYERAFKNESTTELDPWVGSNEIKVSEACLPDKIDLSNSEVECRKFVETRHARVENLLIRSPFVYLTGLTGVGKSTFVDEAYGRSSSVNLYKGFSKIVDWLSDNSDKRALLFLDEENLSDNAWSLFYDLLTHKDKSVFYDGKIYYIGSRHKIIFAGNPLNYGAGRRSSKLFSDYGSSIVFPLLPYSLLYEKILKPILSSDARLIEYQKRVSEIFLDVYKFFSKHSEKEVLITPRELQMMALLTVSHIQHYSISNMASDIIRIATHYAGEIGRSVCPDNLLGMFDSSYSRISYTPHPFAKEYLLESDSQVLVTESRHYIVTLLQDMFDLRKIRERVPSDAIHPAFLYGGLGGVVLEGAPALGKSELMKAILSYNGFKKAELDFIPANDNKSPYYYHLPASVNNEIKKEILIRAFHAGCAVWIDEINSSPSIEGLINHLLMGYTPDGERPKKPGFLLLGTQNPLEMGGRYETSNAVKRRMLQVKLPEYPREDIQKIIQHWGVNEFIASQIAKAYTELRLREGSINNPLNLRHLAEYVKGLNCKKEVSAFSVGCSERVSYPVSYKFVHVSGPVVEGGSNFRLLEAPISEFDAYLREDFSDSLDELSEEKSENESEDGTPSPLDSSETPVKKENTDGFTQAHMQPAHEATPELYTLNFETLIIDYGIAGEDNKNSIQTTINEANTVMKQLYNYINENFDKDSEKKIAGINLLKGISDEFKTKKSPGEIKNALIPKFQAAADALRYHKHGTNFLKVLAGCLDVILSIITLSIYAWVVGLKSNTKFFAQKIQNDAVRNIEGLNKNTDRLVDIFNSSRGDSAPSKP